MRSRSRRLARILILKSNLKQRVTPAGLLCSKRAGGRVSPPDPALAPTLPPGKLEREAWVPPNAGESGTAGDPESCPVSRHVASPTPAAPQTSDSALHLKLLFFCPHGSERGHRMYPKPARRIRRLGAPTWCLLLRCLQTGPHMPLTELDHASQPRPHGRARHSYTRGHVLDSLCSALDAPALPSRLLGLLIVIQTSRSGPLQSQVHLCWGNTQPGASAEQWIIKLHSSEDAVTPINL